jgi:DNA-binding response OmpR family regulator
MMTGVPNEAAVLKEMNVGADDVLIKPFDVSDHMSRVTKLPKEHPGCKVAPVPKTCRATSCCRGNSSLHAWPRDSCRVRANTE